MGVSGARYRLVSADSHVVEPPDLWEEWLEKKYQDKAPKLVKDRAGGDAWQFNPGEEPASLGLIACVGVPPDKINWYGWRYGHEVHPSCHEGNARLEALDVDGVDAEVLYPSPRAIWAFMGYEPEVQLAGIHAYNRWLFDGFCSADPDRLLGSYVIPNLGIETSVAELRRAHQMGARSVVLNMWPTGKELISREDDPFWAAAEELGIPVSIHFKLASQKAAPHPPEARGAMGAAAGMSDMVHLMVDLIFTGTFDRFPNLKVVAVETGCGWIPHFLAMMDDRYWRNRAWAGTTLRLLPSEYFHNNWLATFVSGSDRIAIEIRHAVGLENIAWSTDFPHHGNDWPQSRKVLEDLFVNVPAGERDLIVAGNAARLYHLA